MNTPATFMSSAHNPDVLSCIANLSSDEVFTPPSLVNQMLDDLEHAWSESNNGELIWSNPVVTFLDPCTKSGVFLREIVQRLVVGQEDQENDLAERVDRILRTQVFGIGITNLTALLARRSVYCSKFADGAHSVFPSANSSDGNIWFDRIDHTWVKGRCGFCGASEREYLRTEELETYAYAFIHSDSVVDRMHEIFGENMNFDVVIGNPPYQLGDGGGEGSSAVPLYHHFVDAAKALDPRFISMIIPARWYSGGKGLDEFRQTMIDDERIAQLHDFAETDLVFPNVNIRGGVCYFVWDRGHLGTAKIVNHRSAQNSSEMQRRMRIPGVETFIRSNEAVSILQKVASKQEETFSTRVMARNPFGIPANFLGYSSGKSKEKPLVLFRSRRGAQAASDKIGYVSESVVLANQDIIHKEKVLVSKASPGGDEIPHMILGRPFRGPKGSVCTETYLVVDLPPTEEAAEMLLSYISTRFFRFMVSLVKTTQNISRASFALVPVQEDPSICTDDLLYEKYGLTSDEVRFIESMVRPMELADD